ncbi:MAG: hypothetical protein ACYS1A_11460 [Planctomycetota bacterium]|jgi:hypothetical protein
MSEIENNVKGHEAKTSKLAKASFFITIGVFVGWLCYILLLRSRKFDDLPHIFLWVIGLAYYFLPVSFIFGIWALIKIKKSRGLLKGYTFAILGILMFIPSCLCGSIALDVTRLEGNILVCKRRMMTVAKMIRFYANEHNNQYPAVSQWCDLLYKNKDIREEEWRNERYHYAFNPNCEPNSPPDMVLLFETKGGWNKSGGLEILSYENHYVKGCNILFNDGRVKFVKPKKLNKLKWGDEQKNK